MTMTPPEHSRPLSEMLGEHAEIRKAALEEAANAAKAYREDMIEASNTSEGEGAQLVYTGACMAASAIIDRIEQLKS